MRTSVPEDSNHWADKPILLFNFEDGIDGELACHGPLDRAFIGDLLETGALGVVEIAFETQGDIDVLGVERAIGAGVFEIQLD